MPSFCGGYHNWMGFFWHFFNVEFGQSNIYAGFRLYGLEKTGIVEQWLDEEWDAAALEVRPPRRRPLLAVCIMVLSGTAIGLSAPIPSLCWLGPLLLFLLPLFLFIHRPSATGFVLSAVLLLAAAHARFAVEPRGAASLDGLFSRDVEYIRFIAVITTDARLPPPEEAERNPTATVQAQIEGINRDGTWRRVADPVRIILREPLPERLPAYGEKWQFQGRVESRRFTQNGLFTLPENRAIIHGDNIRFLSAGHGFPLKAWCLDRRRAARLILSRGLEARPTESGVLYALLLGYREFLPAALRKDFSSTGTIHIFAISGAHVGMVAILLAGLLRALGIPIHRWLPFMASGLLIYILMTGAATSAIRAFIMSSAFFAAPFFRRRNDSLSALSLAALGILAVSPTQLGDLGFILSFSAVAGLLSIQPIFERWSRRKRQDLLAASMAPTPTLPLRARLAAFSTLRYSTVSLSAWLSTAPFTAYFFNLFSPIALLLNLIVIPSAFLILLAGVLSLISSPFSAALSETFNLAAFAFIRMLLGAIDFGARLPHGHVLVRTPPGLLITAIYFLLIVGCIATRRSRKAWPATLLLIATLTGAYALHETLQNRITLFAVGDGHAILFKTRNRHILLDTGPARQSPLPRQLRREGVNRLDTVILSHADSDHTGALEKIAAETPITEIRHPGIIWKNSTLHTRLDELHLPTRLLHSTDAGTWPGGFHWQVLWPIPTDKPLKNADEASLVLRVTHRKTAMLFPADLSPGAQTRLLATTPSGQLAAQILLLPQHGEADSLSPGFLTAVAPQDILLSAAPHAHNPAPAPDIARQIETTHARLHSTAPTGQNLILTFPILPIPFLPPYRITPAHP